MPLPDRPVAAAAILAPFERSPKALAVELSVGSNYLRSKFSGGGEAAAERMNEATNGAPGRSAGLHLSYPLGKAWHAVTGLRYHRTHTTLTYGFTLDTLLPHPNLPGETQRATAEYSLGHNNHLSWLSVPVSLAYRRSWGRAEFGLAGGLRLNYQLSANGKVLQASGFAAPIRTAEETRRLHLSYALSPSLAFPLGDGPWSLQIRADVERLNFGVSAASGLERQSWLFGGTVGLRRTFGSSR